MAAPPPVPAPGVSFRKETFKVALKSEDARKKRTEATIQIRKNKRLEGLKKKRCSRNAPDLPPASSAGGEAARDTSKTAPKVCTLVPNDVKIEHLEVFVRAACSDVTDAQLEGVRQIRRLLSCETDPPVQAVVDCGVLPRLAELLADDSKPEVQFEAAWALTNIASTDSTQVVVDLGVTPQLVALMRSQDADVREQSCWAIGNIAGDGHKLRDLVLSIPGAVENVMLNIAHPASLSLLRNATWTLSNFCRGKPQTAVETLRPILEVLAQLLDNADTEVLTDTCWALSYVSDGDDAHIQAVLDAGVGGRLVELLGHTSHSVLTPALRTVGNIVSGNHAQTQSMLEAGALHAFATLLASPKRNIRKETCWALSNVAAGTPEQVGALSEVPGIIPGLVRAVSTGEWNVKKEAAWAVSNMATAGTAAQVRELVGHDAIPALCELLPVDDNRVTTVALDALDAILRSGAANVVPSCGSEMPSEYCNIVEECGGVDKIEELQEHVDEGVYRKASKLISDYFSVDEGAAEGENAMPGTTTSAAGATHFTFGAHPCGGEPAPSNGFGGFPAGASAGGHTGDFTF